MSGGQQQGLGISENRSLESVEEYEFEPIKGYPMLQWRGKRPYRSTRYYPAQLKEVHGSDVEGWRNKLYRGDNLQVMSHLVKQYRGKVKLIYIDPPFDSHADYRLRIKLRGQTIEGEKSLFEEKQYGDIWLNDDYLQFIYERIVLMRELLDSSGCIYVHCDYRRSHHIRCILDEVFDTSHCLNELVWKRTSARSDSATFNHIHDTLFLFSKGNRFTFNQTFIPYEQSYVERYFTYRDADGRAYATIDATQAGLRTGLSGTPWRGFDPGAKGNHWKFGVDKLEELNKQNKIYWPTKEGGWPRLKMYLDETKGAAIQSIWSDIKAVNSQADERGDYPTQKPQALLERIIEASSNPGDIVFDCFMGSGTTQAVALKLGRRFIGADINLGAVQITTKRLLQVADDLAITKSSTSKLQQAAIAYDDSAGNEGDGGEGKNIDPSALQEPIVYYTGFEVYNVNYYDVFRNPIQAKELLLQALEVQPLAAGNVFDGTKGGRMVKVMPVNRIATRADLNDLLANIDQRAMERLYQENPNRVVEKITLICMGHEPDLAAYLKQELHPYKVDVEVVDVLRDRQDLQFKRDSEARVKVKNGALVIDAFYPMNLLQKLSMQKEAVDDWRELVESVMIDWNYDGAVLTPALVDIPERDELVSGTYNVPADAGTIRVKITDLLSESWEGTVVSLS